MIPNHARPVLVDSLNVLLIEGNPGDALVFEEHLRDSEQEARLRWEESVDAGLEAIDESSPDVVILGISDGEGPETIEAVAGSAPTLPIVALTGQKHLERTPRGPKGGAVESLQREELTPALVGRTVRWAARQGQLEAELRQRDAWLQSVTEHVSAGMFRAGPTGRIEKASEGLLQMLGFEREAELIGRDLTTLSADFTQWGRMLAEEGTEGTEMMLRRRDGSVLVGLLSAEATYNADGEVLHYDGVITEVTEQKEAEARLRILSEAVDQTNEAVLITEAEPLHAPGPRIVYVNEAFEEMTGYTEEEIWEKSPRILQGPKTDRETLDALRAALEAGESWQGEAVNYRKDGTPYVVEWSISPVRGKEGEIEYWLSVQRDVTEEREQEEALRRQTHFLEQAQRLAGAWEVDLDTEEVRWSEKVYEIHELSPNAEVDLEEAIEFVTPDVRPRIREAFKRCVEEGETYDLELPLDTANGNRRWVRAVGAPAERENGEVVKVAGAMQDITDRKEAEEALRESEELHRATLSNITDAVLITQEDGTFCYVCPNVEYIFGYDKEEVEDLGSISALLGSDPAQEHDFEDAREISNVEHTALDALGGRHDLLINIRQVEIQNGRRMYTCRDITERKRQERRRKQVIRRVTDAIVEVDSEWRFTLLNEQAEALYDREEEDLLGKNFWDVFESARGTRFEETYRRVMETREPESLVEQFPRLDGWFDIQVYPNEDGGLAFYFKDVTDRKERERRLNAVFNNTYQFTGLMEPDGTVIEVNDTALEFGGLSEEDVLGGAVWETYWFQVGSETKQRLRESVQRAAEGEFIRYEVEVQGAEERRIIDFSIRPVTNEAGEVVLLVPEGRDITDRKEAEGALREERDRFATLFHNLPTPVVHGWPDEQQRIRVQAVNEAFESTFGRALEDVQGEDIQSIIVPEGGEEGAETIRQTLLKGESVNREVQREAGGELRDFRLQVALRTMGETPVEGFAIYTDITEQKRRERTLQEREEKTAALYTATQQLVSAQTRQEVAEQIQTLVGETFDYPLSGVHFVENGDLVPAAISPQVSDRMPDIPTPRRGGASLGARAYRSGETVVAEELSEVESEIDYGDLGAGAAVPLGDHGVLSVSSVQTGGIDDFDVQMLELLGAHAATVLDRIERESTLREERDLLDRILETSPVAIAVFNLEGEFVQASGRAEEVLGLERDEVTDRTYNDPAWGITAPDGSPMPDEKLPFARVMSTGEPVHDVEHAIEWPDGRRRLLSVSGAPLRSPDGQMEGAVFHIDDVTERRKAERQLRESERRFRKLFTEAPIGIARVGLDGRIIETNAAFRDTLGYDAEALRGQHFRSFTYEEDVEEAQEGFDALKRGECSSYKIEKRYRRGDGAVFWARLTVSFLNHESETQIIAMMQDIDDQKRYQEQLRAAKEEAERLNRLKSAFLANMSHEVRTPLTSIIGFAEMIAEQVDDEATGGIRQYAQLIEKSGHRLLNTLDGVINLSKLESGEMDLSANVVNLAAEAEDIAQQFEPQARDAGLDLRLSTGEPPVLCHADPDGLRVVLRNLLSNAIKYTDAGGTVWIRARAGDEAVVLEVEDTGIGMDPEKTDQLFEAFAQESEGIGREYEGTGLGLTVSRRAIEEMRGSIEVDTRKGEGSCFTVRLPRADGKP